MSEKKQHWENIYSTRIPEKLSWTQDRPSPSIEWILECVPDRNAGIIDVGGGNSSLIDCLLDAEYEMPTVLDISQHALEQSQNRLGDRHSKVEWIEGDVTSFSSSRKYALWHDRAVFHFLTNQSDRMKYVVSLRRALLPKGKVIIATFSPEGPKQCSGLDIMRFSEIELAEEFGCEFSLLRHDRKTHLTPWGSKQEFQYCLFEKSI